MRPPSPCRALGAWLVAITLSIACAGDEPPVGSETGDAGSTSDPASEGSDASTATPEPGTTDTGAADGSSGGTDTGSTGELGAIAGSITRTAMPTGDATGTVYVAVFADNPITNMQAATLGQAVLEDSDMSDPSAALTYLIEELPVRAEPYHVVAFLDDDGDASMDAPGPDMGDLVTLDGTGTPTVVVTAGRPVAMNLVLNAVMPF